MSVLHHVSMALGDADGWDAMASAVVDGDTVVLLDSAARELQLGFPASAAAGFWSLLAQRPRVRWLLPDVERTSAAILPDAVEVIDEVRWLDLIVAHPLLLEWS